MIYKTRTKILISIFVFILLFFAHTALDTQFMVTRVIDGDTVKARSISKEITIRLVGIDAPEASRKKNEPGQPFNRKDRDYLTDLVLNKMIEIDEYGTDRCRRILAVIYVNSKNVNLRMVQVGLAEAYKGRPAKGFNPQLYKIAEQEARKK